MTQLSSCFNFLRFQPSKLLISCLYLFHGKKRCYFMKYQTFAILVTSLLTENILLNYVSIDALFIEKAFYRVLLVNFIKAHSLNKQRSCSVAMHFELYNFD